MKIWKLSDLADRVETCSAFLPADSTDRQINIYKFNNVSLVGENTFFPNVLLYDHLKDEIYNPSEEKVMSLPDLDDKDYTLSAPHRCETLEGKYFYFIYNTDNYYHFLYDSLPYLISYLHLKKRFSNLKLLMSFPNASRKENYRFVDECLELIGIDKEDIIIAKEKTIYRDVYVSSSYTYGSNPSAPPRKEIYQIYDLMAKTAVSMIESTEMLDLDNIYISRRSWVHKDYSNIGTNYTDRRKMMNEDQLVERLSEMGFVEIFCERLTMAEKIYLFRNAKKIAGAIGGGLANVLFSTKQTQLLCILSPSFIEYNKRFLHSFFNTSVTYTSENKFYEEGEYKSYMRIRLRDNKIGEIKEIYNDEILMQYTDETVAGWNSQRDYKIKKINKSDIVWHDSGINSPWVCDIDEVYKLI